MVWGPKALITKQQKNPRFDNPNETFTLNLKYSSPALRVNQIPDKELILDDENKEENGAVSNDQIEQMRVIQLQGAIVKIMKTN